MPRLDYPVIDVDVHIHERNADLAEHAEGTLREALDLARGAERWLDTPGYSPLTIYDPPLGEDSRREIYLVRDPEGLRRDLDARGIDAAIVYTGRLLAVPWRQDRAYPAGIMRAFNRYLRERWLRPEQGIFGAILAVPQDPAAAAREIEAHADAPGVAAVCLPMASVAPLWGHPQYDPIYAAAEAAGLPVVLKGFTHVYPVFPYQLEGFDTALAKQVVGRPFGALANLISLATTGVFTRFPRLRVIFTECGVSWLPFALWRLDEQHRFLPHELDTGGERPSELVRRRVYVTTHRLESPPNPAALAMMIEAAGLAEQVVFATDWPHYDADSLERVLGLGLPADLQRRILGENARTAFRLPTPGVS